MRISITMIFGVMLLFGISGQLAISQNSNFAIPQSVILEDPNLDPNWDWRIGDYPDNIYPFAQYKIYARNSVGNIVDISIDAPTGQPNAWSGLLDNLKDDGWVLLLKDFGTSIRPVVTFGGSPPLRPPHFVLYNKYRSILRFFINVQTPGTWTKGFVEMQFRDPTNTNKTPAVLAHLKPVADAVDKYQNMKDNISSVFSEKVRQGLWLWADFPLSFDPTIALKADVDPPSFYFQIYGQKLEDIQLKGISTGASGDANFVNTFLTGAGNGNGSFGIPNLRMPNVKDLKLGEFNYKASGTSTDWSSFTNYFDKIKIKIPSVGASNPFKGLFDGFSTKLLSFASALPISLPGLDIGGLFDFFINGGAKSQQPAQPAPTYIAMNLELAGTITQTVPLHEIRVTIPSTRDEYWKPTLGSAVGIVRNDPVGILTLTKTPTIFKRNYKETVSYNYWGTDYDIPIDVNFVEYEIGEDIQFKLNLASGLELIKTQAFLIVDCYGTDYPTNNETRSIYKWMDLTNQEHLLDFEAPINASSAIFRTLPVPIKFAKGRTIQLLDGSESNVRLKINAVLKRKDDPNAQPVIFIATYNVNIEDKNGLCKQALPTIPPQNVKCAVSSTGATVTWDANPEKNIKFYTIERSINGWAYVQVGTSTTTSFVDAEIQKAVKPYQTNRQNVSVNYRVKAYSYWFDYENGIAKSQYSAYSDIVNIYGSINMFWKRDLSQIIPESNSLSQNFPNPFNPTTTIYYGIQEPGNVTVKIFNTLGQEIITLVNERKEIGYHYVEWNATNLSSGVYFCKIQSGNFTESKKMTLTK